GGGLAGAAAAHPGPQEVESAQTSGHVHDLAAQVEPGRLAALHGRGVDLRERDAAGGDLRGPVALVAGDGQPVVREGFDETPPIVARQLTEALLRGDARYLEKPRDEPPRQVAAERGANGRLPSGAQFPIPVRYSAPAHAE